MIDSPRRFDDTLYENQFGREMGFRTPLVLTADQPLYRETERVSRHVDVHSGPGLGNEEYRRVAKPAMTGEVVVAKGRPAEPRTPWEELVDPCGD